MIELEVSHDKNSGSSDAGVIANIVEDQPVDCIVALKGKLLAFADLG